MLHQRFIPARVCLLSTVLCAGVAFAQNASPKYAFKVGQQYMYEIKIEAELPGEKQIMQGNTQYEVTTVDSSGQMSLVNTGALVTRHEVKQQQPGRFPGRPGGPRGFGGISGAARRELTIDPYGTVVKAQGELQLPFLLGNIAQLILEPLPKEGQRTWETKREITIQEKDNSRFPPLPFGRQQDNGTRRSAHETVTYSLGAVNGNTIEINRKIDLRTDEKAGSESVFEQTGDGKILFNLQDGVPQSMEMKLTMKVNQDNTSVRIPTTITARRLTAEEVQQAMAAAAEAQAKAQAAIEEANRPKELTEADVDQVLEDLKARDVFKVNGALDRLGKAIVIEGRRDQVATALVGLLNDRDNGIRSRTVKALGIWGTQEQAPELIKLLDDQDAFVKGNSFEALGKLGGKDAADAVAAFLPDFFKRRDASQALQHMGEEAEAPVLPHLKNKDNGVKSEAVKILALVGTRKSLADLEKLAKSDKGPLGKEADKAIDAIKERAREALKTKKEDTKPATPAPKSTTTKPNGKSTTPKPKR